MLQKPRVALPALIVVLTGCAGSPTFQEVPGAVYADYTMGREAAGPLGTRSGRACATSILGWFASGDASIAAAAANGGITRVSHVDRESTNLLGIHATYCTLVYGD